MEHGSEEGIIFFLIFADGKLAQSHVVLTLRTVLSSFSDTQKKIK